MKKFLSMIFCSALIVGAEAISPLPSKQWKIMLKNAADRLEIQEKNGVLLLNYKLHPVTVKSVGLRMFFQGEADLLLRKPLLLTQETERILYEFTDLRKRIQGTLQFCPLVRDREGEFFVFTPHAYPHLNSKQPNWSRWMTAGFFSGEAGAATTDVYYTDGKGNRTPDLPLELLGFRLILRTPYSEKLTWQKNPVSGTAALGDFDLSGVHLPQEDPFAYAAGFLKEKGTYLFAAQIRNRFQGLPIREFRQRIMYDPADPATGRQKLIFPLGTEDNYWINYTISKENGSFVSSGFLRAEVIGKTASSPIQYVDPETPPPAGYLRINPMHKTCGVYDRKNPMSIQVRLFPQGKRVLTLRWQLLDYNFMNDVFDSGCQQVDFGGKNFLDLVLSPKTNPERDIYVLKVELLDEKQVVDSHIYYTGFRTDPMKSHDRAGALADRHEIKRDTYYRTTFPGSLPFIHSEAQLFRYFDNFFRTAKSLALSHTYMVDLYDFEVLPGVFNYTLLDKMMDTAADHGCRITIRFSHIDKNDTTLYRWPKYIRQYNYDGSVIKGHPYYGSYGVTDPRIRKVWFDAYRMVYNRYKKHTAFEGYYIMQPAGESTVVDVPWEGCVVGYDPVFEQEFQRYLKRNYSIKELNSRWKSNCADFGEIHSPLPTFRDGMKPDLRMKWVDFCRFKTALDVQYWFPEAVNHIRSFDMKRVIIIYGIPSHYRNLYGKLDYCHNGGNHSPNDLGQYIEAWEKGGIGWITEPHHPICWAAYGDPAGKGRVLDYSVWIMLAQAGGGGANLHVYYKTQRENELDRVSLYGAEVGLDTFERFRPILAELQQAKAVLRPRQVAVLQDIYTLYCKHRTTFRPRLADLSRWFDLLKNDAVPHENLNKANLSSYKLIIPNILDEVISAETLDIYEEAVRHGAKMILSANTGKYVPEFGNEPFQLLRRFGIIPPRNEFCCKGTNIMAEIAPDAKVFFGNTKKIRIQTSDSFHMQLNNPEIQKNFNNYPYRWIPETNYFGYYPDHSAKDGKVLARFSDGGAALSSHRFGKGEIFVFWGTPDLTDHGLKGMMKRFAFHSGVNIPSEETLPFVFEMTAQQKIRHYLLVFNDRPGTYTLPVPNVPDGDWFLDDPVSSMRLGRYDGKYMRENGLELTWTDGYSPLKFIRMIPAGNIPDWKDKYRIVPKVNKKGAL